MNDKARSNRRRTALAGLGAAALALGVAAAPSAQAAPAVDASSVTASEWACLAVGEIDLGLCIDNPIPDTSGLPTVPEILGNLLGSLG